MHQFRTACVRIRGTCSQLYEMKRQEAHRLCRVELHQWWIQRGFLGSIEPPSEKEVSRRLKQLVSKFSFLTSFRICTCHLLLVLESPVKVCLCSFSD